MNISLKSLKLPKRRARIHQPRWGLLLYRLIIRLLAPAAMVFHEGSGMISSPAMLDLISIYGRSTRKRTLSTLQRVWEFNYAAPRYTSNGTLVRDVLGLLSR